MDNIDSSHESTLAEQAQTQNSRLQLLIEGIAQLIIASRELLARLQPAITVARTDTTKQE